MGKIWDNVKFKILGGSVRALNIVKAKYLGKVVTKDEVQMYYCVVKDYLRQCKDLKLDLNSVTYEVVDNYIENKSKEIIVENEKEEC